MSNELDRILAEGLLRTLFQPIVCGTTRDALGFEALTRGPAQTAFESPAALFALAHLDNRSLDLERACIASALKAFSAARVEGYLFLNVLPDTLLRWHEFPSWLARECGERNVDPHAVVLELTEHGHMPGEQELSAAIAPLRVQGFEIAIDDLGSGSSGLKNWSVIRPEYVKVDRYFVADIESDPVRAEILRAVVEMGRATGCHVVAEGVENREQCGLLLELGIDYLQGYHLGRPDRVPKVDSAALASMDRTAPGHGADCAEQLAHRIPPVISTTQVGEVVERFRQSPTCSAFAVTHNERAIGIVRRDELLIFLSKPLHPELFYRKPVTSVMDASAVQIDARARLEQVSRMVTGRLQSDDRGDFIVTRHGRYLGIGRTLDLLRGITAQQIQAAKQSNPLTGLPGNREIQLHLGQWIKRRRTFIACHLDLDHFKPFNDVYGYDQGDQVLLHVAQVIARHLRPRVDFAGHVGGDDFVFLMRSRDWPLRLGAMLQELAVSLGNFHPPQAREAQGFHALDRDGTPRRFGLLSASIGAIEIDPGHAPTLESVAERLRSTKTLAKARQGNSCVLESGGQVRDLTTDTASTLPHAALELPGAVAVQ